MIEWVHADISEAVFLCIRNPAFPNSRCALVDAVNPWRLIALHKERICHFILTVFWKRRTKIICSEEAGRKPVAVRLYLLNKLIGKNLCIVGINEVKGKSKDFIGLGLSDKLPVLHVVINEVSISLFSQLLIMLGSVGFTENVAHLYHKVNIVYKINGRNIRFVALIICKPVTEAGICACHAELINELSNVFLHWFIMRFKKLNIFIHNIHVIRDNYACICPCRFILRMAAKRFGNNLCISAVVTLGIAGILDPLAEEFLDIRIISSRYAERLCVTCPAVTLITLRAIGRHTQIVAALTPKSIWNKFVDKLVGGFKRSYFFCNRTYNLGNKIKYFNILRWAYLNITIAVKSKWRSVNLLILTAEYICFLRKCGSEIDGVKWSLCAVISSWNFTAVVQKLGIVNINKCSSFTFKGQLSPADHFLTEVNDKLLTFFER